MTKSRERAQESRKRACTVTANGEENKLWKDDSLMIEKELMGLWLNTLASKSPVPGGGGASAIGGALAAALGQMVANLTVGKKKYAAVEETMQEVLGKLQTCQADFLDLVDQDAKVFAPLAAAYALPTSTEEEKQEKARIMEERLLAASLVPLHMMEKAAEMLEFLEILAEKGSRMALLAGVGISAAGCCRTVCPYRVDRSDHECLYQHQIHEEPGKGRRTEYKSKRPDETGNQTGR